MLPSEPSFKKNLLGMIDRLIGGEWSVDEFETAYYDYFVDTVPSSFLSDEDEDFFAAVQERLNAEREVGWLTHDEYIQWLRTERELHFGSAGRDVR
jgi:hypothetical protein